MAAQKGIGRLIQIGLAKEATRGTAASAASYWTPFMDLTLDEKKDFATDDQSYGIIEDSTNLTEINRRAEGTIQGNFADETAGLLLYSLFGGYAVAAHAGETLVYDHTFTIGENAQHQSLTYFLHDPLSAQDYTYANGVVSKFELTAELKKFIAFNASVMSKTGATASSFTPATTSENRFVPQNLTATFDASYGSIGSGTTVALKTAKVTYTPNVEIQDVLGSLDPADFLNKEFAVEIELEAIWQNESDFKTAFMGPTPQAVRLSFVNSDVTIGSATNPTLTLDFAKVTFQELSRPVKVKDLVYQTIKGKAVYSTTDTLMAKAVLTNTVTTY